MSTGDARQEPRHRPSREQVRGRNRARPLAVAGVLTLAGLAAGLMTAPLADAAGARLPHLRFGGGTATFTYTGAEQTFTVPAGTSSVSITAIGAAGGAGQNSTSSGGAGGQGQSVTGIASVSPGETLYVEVGGVGSAGSIGGNGGFNGGANGSSYHSIVGGGGGGASDVRTISGTLGSRLVVAGGGGGGGGSSNGCTGNGGAGGNAGAAGSAAATVTGCGSITGGGGGGAGTGVGGGTAGAPGAGGCCGTAASAGTSGSGGAGGNIVGGGGGGGYYGGGGGGAGTDEIGPTSGGGGGGGGSSLDTTDNGAVSSAASVTITYTSSVPVAKRPSLGVSLRHHGVFYHGGTGEFDIWVTNNGGAPAEQTTTAMLHVPAGLSIIQGGKGPGWACHKGGHETTCRRSNPIGAGRSVMIAVTVRVKAAAGRTLHATATISPTDTTPATGTSTDSVAVAKRPSLGVSLRHHGVFYHGGTGEFDIWVTNNGGAPAEQTTTAMLHVPAGLSIIQGGKGPGWACHKGGHETTCRRSNPIGAGRSVMIAVTVRVKAAAGRTLHATATISPTDTTPATGTSTDKVIIRP